MWVLLKNTQLSLSYPYYVTVLRSGSRLHCTLVTKLYSSIFKSWTVLRLPTVLHCGSQQYSLVVCNRGLYHGSQLSCTVIPTLLYCTEVANWTVPGVSTVHTLPRFPTVQYCIGIPNCSVIIVLQCINCAACIVFGNCTVPFFPIELYRGSQLKDTLLNWVI